MVSIAFVGAIDYIMVARASLSSKIILDIVFLLLNIRNLQIRGFEIVLLSFLLWSGLLGGMQLASGNPQYDFWRVVKDLVPAVLFFLKLGVFRQLLVEQQSYTRLIVVVCSIFSAISILVFNALGGYSTGYVGLTPPVSMLAAYALSTHSPMLFLLSCLIIFASGKRSFLISVIIGLGFALLKLGKTGASNNKRWRFGFITGLFMLIAMGTQLVWENAMVDKVMYTVSSLQESGVGDKNTSTFKNAGVTTDQELLDAATGGRLREITAVTSEMKPIDWVVGAGAGFTYTLGVYDNVVVDRYANTHFSPLSLTYKFGLPFAVIFYWWIIATVFSVQDLNRSLGFWVTLLVLFVLQSIFAYNLFVESLLPFAIANVQYQKSMLDQKSRVSMTRFHRPPRPQPPRWQVNQKIINSES